MNRRRLRGWSAKPAYRRSWRSCSSAVAFAIPMPREVFLDPKLNGLREPDELPGVPAAADRLWPPLPPAAPIVVYGDYDADGMTATAIMLECLKLLGAKASFYVPNRIDEGYGLNDEAIRTLAERGAAMIVTVDCGIASVEEAKAARELGLELIVTDHHEMAAELARRGRDCSSAVAGASISIRRFERRGRGVQTGVGAVPASLPIEEGGRCHAFVLAASRRLGRPRHRGRRRAAGG